MSATDPIVSKHNTALIETHSLLLVPGSAREYEHHRQEIRGASAPVGETFAVACGSIGAILLAVGGSLWGYEALAGIRFP